MENLKLNDDSLAFLRRAAGWAKFLAIMGFIVIGLTFVNELIAATLVSIMRRSFDVIGLPIEFSDTFKWIYFGVLLALTAVCVLPMIYLYCFANKLRNSIDNGDTLTLALSLRSLKRYFIFCSVVIMVWLIFIMLLIIPIAMMIGAII